MVHTAAFWAKSFMHEFREVCDGQRESTRKLPTLPIKEVSQFQRVVGVRFDLCLCVLSSRSQSVGVHLRGIFMCLKRGYVGGRLD